LWTKVLLHVLKALTLLWTDGFVTHHDTYTEHTPTTDDASGPSAGLIRETQMIREEASGRGGLIAPLDWRKVLPFEAAAASDRLGWVGLEAAHFRASPAFERTAPGITHHRLVFVARPPEELDLCYDGVKRHRPPPTGSIMLVPAARPRCAQVGTRTSCSSS
jgi:hypothetical protein